MRSFAAIAEGDPVLAEFHTLIPDPVRQMDDTFLETCHETITRLLNLWESKRKGAALPARRDLEPFEIKELLPYVILVDVSYPGPEFFYRLVGTQEVEFRGYDPTGRPVKDAFSGLDGGFCDGNYRAVVDRKAPIFVQEYKPTRLGAIAQFETIFLPFADDGETVNIIMVYSYVKLGLGDEVIPEVERMDFARGR